MNSVRFSRLDLLGKALISLSSTMRHFQFGQPASVIFAICGNPDDQARP
jgi:hypothetical protein